MTLDPDPGDKGEPITQNGYIYCNNNPVNAVDPSGTYVPGFDGERYVENSATGWGRITGDRHHPEDNGKYRVSKHRMVQVTIDGNNLIHHNRETIRGWIQKEGRYTAAKRTKRWLASDTHWNYKNRKDLKGLKYEVNGKVYDAARFGNMMVGAAGKELGVSLSTVKQVSGVYQAKFDLPDYQRNNYRSWAKRLYHCFTIKKGFASCDSDLDNNDYGRGYYLY